MRLLRAWLPPTLWALVIYMASALSGSALPPLPALNADKLVHACVYAVLGALLVRAIRDSTRFGRGASVLLAGLLATGYGASDELHQRFVPFRSPDPADLAADAVGGLLGALTFTLIVARRLRRDR